MPKLPADLEDYINWNASWLLRASAHEARFAPLPIGLPQHADGLHRGNLRAAGEAEAAPLGSNISAQGLGPTQKLRVCFCLCVCFACVFVLRLHFLCFVFLERVCVCCEVALCRLV